MHEIARERVIEVARSYLGVKYLHQGRNRAGIDCAGLIVCMAHDLGIAYDEGTPNYARTPDGRALLRTLDQHALRLPIFLSGFGDILVLRFVEDPQHLAIKTNLGIIHCYAAAEKVVEHRLADVWAKKILACYAFPGVI